MLCKDVFHYPIHALFEKFAQETGAEHCAEGNMRGANRHTKLTGDAESLLV